MREFINIVEGIVGPYTGQGPLWHGTDILGLTGIIRADYMSPSIDTNDPQGVSLTTSERMAWGFADRSSYIFAENHGMRVLDELGETPTTGAVLEFNAAALAAEYRLIEYMDGDITDEDEVRVVTPRLTNVSRHLVRFSFHPADLDYFIRYMQTTDASHDYTDPKAFAAQIANLVKHPKFEAI